MYVVKRKRSWDKTESVVFYMETIVAYYVVIKEKALFEL